MKSFFLFSMIIFLLSTTCCVEAQQSAISGEENNTETSTFIAEEEKAYWPLGAPTPEAVQAAKAFIASKEHLSRTRMEIYHQDRITPEQDQALYERIREAERYCVTMYNRYLQTLELDTMTHAEFWNAFYGRTSTTLEKAAYPFNPDSTETRTSPKNKGYDPQTDTLPYKHMDWIQIRKKR